MPSEVPTPVETPSPPVVETATAELLSLPLYPELSDEQALAVVASLREALRELG